MNPILIVDDKREILWMHQEIITTVGYRSVCAANGIEAQKIISSQAIDLILSDIQMPEMDGVELLSWVTSNHTHIPVILCSGEPLPKNVEGHRAFLQKPIPINKLISAIEEVLCIVCLNNPD